MFAQNSSIHPQGWVPIETAGSDAHAVRVTPVAFTPKGGCPLKRLLGQYGRDAYGYCSIHPKGWVPIETGLAIPSAARAARR